jgi:hypothetical protein
VRDDGLGERALVATTHISAGERLFVIEGVETAAPDRYTLQIGRDLHLSQADARDERDLVFRRFWRYMNHGCEPATRIVGREVFALRDIAPGELVTFDYNTTERELATPFECRCGSAACVGVVRGAAHLDPAQRAARERWLGDHLR